MILVKTSLILLFTLSAAGDTSPPACRSQDKRDNYQRFEPQDGIDRDYEVIHPMEFSISDDTTFGIELELTLGANVTTEGIAAEIRAAGISNIKDMTKQTRGWKRFYDGWKMVPDPSIYCKPLYEPDCSRFELVSPVLRGRSGLGEVAKIAHGLGSLQVEANEKNGYHLHIDVSNLTLPQLIKVCQNFVKYERIMDRFFPPSRRTGSKGSDRHFKSNRASVAEDRQGVSNREIHDILTRSQSVAELAAAMNRGDRSRHYKLNLENLVSGRQPTIEFRQHVAVTSYRDISAWVCFCSNFVFNSARLRPPSPFASSTTLDERSDALFDYVVKDEELRTFYFLRIEQEAASADGCEVRDETLIA